MHGVLRVALVAKHAKCEPERDAPHTVVELRQRGLVATGDQRHQGLVGEVGVLLAHREAIVWPGNANTVDAEASMAVLRRMWRSGSARSACQPGVEPSGDRARTTASPDHETRGETMRKGIIALGAVGLLTAAAVVGAATLGPGSGTASSHREAPLIAEDPSADLTDLYAFRSPDKPNTVTILANVVPGEDPGRAELVHVLAERALQPQGRHRRRRSPERHLPVPVPHEDRPVLPR